MKTDIETLKDTFKFGYEEFETSRDEATIVWDLYHNRQYNEHQLNVLQSRGQPAETFNIVKLYARMLIGYFSSVVNTVNVLPVGYQDVPTASLLSDIVEYTMRDNNMLTEGDKIKLDGLITGLMCCFEDVVPTGQVDEFGRPLNKIKLHHVPSQEIIIDPLSTLEDYSDARFVHRFKWISEEELTRLYGSDKKDKLEEYYNHLDIPEAEFEYNFEDRFTGEYKIFNNYLVVHSNIIDDEGNTWSIHWCDEVELQRKKLTFSEVKSSYRVQKLHTSDKSEYYGLFREVIETQHAINQALIKLQLLANTEKVFVQDNAVEDIDEFTSQVNRVNAVIKVKLLQGIDVKQSSREVAEQYAIIDKALDRVQRVLGINDSFMGQAFASDSGRKVKLQQTSAVMSLRYVSSRIEQFYRLLGEDITNLVKQFYTATQSLRIVDEATGMKFIQINQPLKVWDGITLDRNNMPQMVVTYEEVLNPETGEPVKDEESGAYLIAPVSDPDTAIQFSNFDVEITSAAYNDEDERNQLMIDTIINGPMGTMLSQANPSGYFKMGALSVKNTKAKHSSDVATILEQTAQLLSPQMQQAMQQGQLQGQAGQGTPTSGANQLAQGAV